MNTVRGPSEEAGGKFVAQSKPSTEGSPNGPEFMAIDFLELGESLEKSGLPAEGIF